MPLHPMNLARPSASRLEPGAVVEYEQHGKALLGVIVAEKRNKWALVNETGQEVELSSDRLSLVPKKAPPELNTPQKRAAFLGALAREAGELSAQLALGEIWELFEGTARELSVEEIEEIAFSERSAVTHLATRRALIADAIYFKRRKTGFEPRPREVIEELKRQAEADERRRKSREAFVEAVIARLGNPALELPPGMAMLEQVAAMGSQAEGGKEALALLEEINDRARLGLAGRAEERAFRLLVSLGHFGPHEDLMLYRLRRRVRFSERVVAEALAVSGELERVLSAPRENLEQLEVFTIDSVTTKDVDDGLSLEETAAGYRLGIHISDVAAFVRPETALEEEAFARASSVYAPDYQIPMLPREISENTLSLVEGKRRAAMSFLVDLDRAFTPRSRRVVRSVIRVKRRLDYDEVDRVLCAEHSEDRHSRVLHTLWSIASAFEERRIDAGSVQFSRRELTARLLPEGTIVLETTGEDTPARKLVSELMVTANESAAAFAVENGLPLIFRGQEPPDTPLAGQGMHLPEGPAREYFLRGFIKRSTTSTSALGHFGLGVQAYTQCTSPIRRVVDLVNQRQLAAFLESGTVFYSPEKLLEVIGGVESLLDEVTHIQRIRNRYWLLQYLVQEEIKEIDAVIVRVDTPRPLAELELLYSIFAFHPARATDRSRLGERIRLRIEQVNPQKDQLVLTEIS